MTGIVARDFSQPDEVRTPPNASLEIVDLGSAKVAHITFRPGWRWSESVKPLAGTESCQMHHVGVVESGTLRVVHDDGTEVDLTPGNVYVIEPGHDAWVVGDEAVTTYEFDASTVSAFADLGK